jgi:hypothetical protein
LSVAAAVGVGKVERTLKIAWAAGFRYVPVLEKEDE